jgi:uncharacterized membrane protein
MRRKEKLIEEDIFADIEPTPHRKLHPKSRKTFIVLMTILIIILIFAIIRAVKILSN